MNENDELEIELDGSDESVDIDEENYVYINVPEEVFEELEEAIRLRALITETGSQIELAINSSTFVLTAKLKDKNGNLIYTSNGIDLPIESMIINGTYNEQTKKLILTLQSGNTIEISLADLISGLVNQTDLEEALEEALQNYYTKSETYNKEETDSIIVEETKKINAVNSRIDRLYNSLSTGHETGESIDINDSADLPLAEFSLGGESEQETTEGNQLWGGFQTYNFTNNGIDFSMNENGTVSMSGTSTGNATLNIAQAINNGISLKLPAGTYTVSKDTINTNYKIQIYDSTSNFIAEVINTQYSNSFILNEEKTIVIRPMISSGNTVNLVAKVMLNAGDTALPFEKYTGGQPSPNPNYESEVHSVGDNVNEFDKDNVTFTIGVLGDDGNPTGSVSSHYTNNFYEVSPNKSYTLSGTLQRDNTSSARIYFYDTNKTWISRSAAFNGNLIIFNTPQDCKFVRIQVVLEVSLETGDIKLEQGTKASPYSPYGMGCASIEKCNKNLFDVTQFEAELVSGKIINDNGVEVSDSTSQYSKYFLFLSANKTYHIKGAFQRLYIYDKYKNFKSRSTAATGMDRNYTPTENEFIRFQITTSYWNENKGTEQVEDGETATTYIAHQGQTYDIYTQQPMRSIGEVRDDFVIINGNKYERHKIYEYTYLGTESGTLITSGVLYRFDIPNTLVTPTASSVVGKVMSNKYLANSYNNLALDDTKTGVCLAYNFNNRIYVSANGKTGEQVSDSLIGTKFYYVLQEPILLPCTNEQSAILDEIIEDGTYKEVTHYFSEDEIEPVLDVTYYQDTDAIQNKRLDDLEARLALLE